MPSRAGSANKNKVFLQNRLKEMLGEDFEPVIEMATAAVKMKKLAEQALNEALDDKGDIADIEKASNAFLMLEKVVTSFEKPAKYVTPQLKAIEHTVSEDTVDDMSELMDCIKDGASKKSRKKY